MSLNCYNLDSTRLAELYKKVSTLIVPPKATLIFQPKATFAVPIAALELLESRMELFEPYIMEKKP